MVVWLLLLLCAAAALPAMLLDLARPDVTDAGEARAVATTIETRRRLAATPGSGSPLNHFHIDRMVPFLNEGHQLRHPPAGTWAQLLTCLGSAESETGQSGVLILRARLASVAFGVLTVIAVYWAGQSIGGTTTAALAAVVCAANPVMLYHARLATAATQHAALVVTAIAAACWAIRPLRPAPSVERQFIGWVTCGLALGAAILTGGPWTALHVLVPLLLILTLCPGRMGHLMGLLAATLIGALLVIPWALYADEHDAGAFQHWAQRLRPTDWSDLGLLARQTRERCGMLVLAMLPWSLWLVAALVQPFSTSSVGSRLRQLIGLLWFLAAELAVVLDPAPVRMADQLVVLPAVAVLIGLLFDRYAELAAEGRYARLWRLLRWPQITAVVLASVGLPAMLAMQPALIERGWLNGMVAQQPKVYYAPGLAIVLLVVAVLALRWSVRHYPVRALACWGLWGLLLATGLMVPLARGPKARSAIRADAERIGQLTVGQPAYYLRDADAREPAPATLLYAGRALPAITPGECEQLIRKQEPFALLAAAAPPPALTRVARLPSLGMTLWQQTPAEPLPSDSTP